MQKMPGANEGMMKGWLQLPELSSLPHPHPIAVGGGDSTPSSGGGAGLPSKASFTRGLASRPLPDHQHASISELHAT